jgi:hypothetical protein
VNELSGSKIYEHLKEKSQSVRVREYSEPFSAPTELLIKQNTKQATAWQANYTPATKQTNKLHGRDESLDILRREFAFIIRYEVTQKRVTQIHNVTTFVR